MAIRSVSLTKSNLYLCEPMGSDRCTYSCEEFRTLIATAAVLLDQHRALGAIVVEGDTASAFGLSAFAAEPFMEYFLGAPHSQIGRRPEERNFSVDAAKEEVAG